MTDTQPEPPRPSSPPGLEDGTLGGYFATHDRPPAFEGPDRHPYTVSVEVEETGDLRSPYHGYLVFPRWAHTGVGIVGHVETDTLATCRSVAEAEERLGALSLVEVQALLNAAVDGREHDDTTGTRTSSNA